MVKFVFAVAAAFASLILVESLICNKCTFNLLGLCINEFNETCTHNTSVCFTGRGTFSATSHHVGLSSQGCKDDATGCDTITSSSVLGVSFDQNVTCCTADNCNPISLSGAPSTFTAAAGGAVLAAVLGSIMGKNDQ